MAKYRHLAIEFLAGLLIIALFALFHFDKALLSPEKNLSKPVPSISPANIDNKIYSLPSFSKPSKDIPRRNKPSKKEIKHSSAKTELMLAETVLWVENFSAIIENFTNFKQQRSGSSVESS